MISKETIMPIAIVLFLIIYTYIKLDGFSDLRALFISKSKYAELDVFFSKYFSYYAQLSDKEKKRYVFRANSLAKNTKFEGKENFEITEKVKLFVVAAQVQLTFGFKYYSLPIFKKVIIHPKSYINSATGKRYFGEVHPKGIIVLSWSKLVRGHLIPDDKINLGLHELAHALMHTIIHSQNHEIGLDPFLRDILKLSKPEIKKIRKGDSHFFRDYAGTNLFEFFAIATEYFFEAPNEFNKELPLIYQYLTKLLKQDPTLKIFRL